MADGDWLKIGFILVIVAVIFLVVYLGDPSAKGAWILEDAGILLGVGGFLSLLAGLVDAFSHSWTTYNSARKLDRIGIKNIKLEELSKYTYMLATKAKSNNKKP